METVAAALIHFALRRSQNVHWQSFEVTQAARAALMGHELIFLCALKPLAVDTQKRLRTYSSRNTPSGNEPRGHQ
jgi:hypothetical protein